MGGYTYIYLFSGDSYKIISFLPVVIFFLLTLACKHDIANLPHTMNNVKSHLKKRSSQFLLLKNRATHYCSGTIISVCTPSLMPDSL